MDKNNNKISVNNYFFALLISFLTILIVGYFAFWYKSNKEYTMNNSVMSNYLAEIGEDEIIDNLTNYVIDNPNCTLYMSFGNDLTIKDFENQFKDLINQNNIKSEFIYADLNLINSKNFVTKIQEEFFSEELKNKHINLTKFTNLFVFKDGKIVDLLYSSKQQINLSDVTIFLIRNGVISND